MMTFKIGSVVAVVDGTTLSITDEAGKVLGKREIPEKASMKLMEGFIAGEKLRGKK